MSLVPGAAGVASSFPDGVTGDTSGVEVTTGKVGEVLLFTQSSGTATTTTADTPIDSHIVSIPAGTWTIFGDYTIELVTGATAAAGLNVGGVVLFTDNANSVQVSAPALFTQPSVQVNRLYVNASFTATVSVSSSTTFKVRISCNQTAGTAGATASIEDHGVSLSGSTITNTASIKAIRRA